MVAERNRPLAEPKQGNLGRHAAPVRESAEEAPAVLGRVAARGRQQADAPPLASGERGDQVGEGTILRASGEVVPTDAEDAAHHAACAGGTPASVGVAGWLAPR